MQDILSVLVPVAAAHLVVLAVIVIVVKRLLIGDTMKAVSRIDMAEGDIRRKEEAVRHQIEQHEREFAAKRAASDEEAARRKEDALKDIGKQKEVMLEEARREANTILDKARKNERKLREQISLEMGGRVVETAGRIVGLVFSDKVTEAVNRAFVDELLDELERTDSSAISVDGRDPQFIASHPIEIGQKLRLQSLLRRKFGVDVLVTETLRKDLLAGLVIKLGSLEIDGSLKSRLDDALAEAGKETPGVTL